MTVELPQAYVTPTVGDMRAKFLRTRPGLRMYRLTDSDIWQYSHKPEIPEGDLVFAVHYSTLLPPYCNQCGEETYEEVQDQSSWGSCSSCGYKWGPTEG